MLSRALTVTAKPRKSPKDGDQYHRKSGSFNDYEDCIVGFMEDIPLVHCGHDKQCVGCGESLAHLTLRGVLRGSVGVLGESRLAMTEKVVVLEGRVCAVKRFRKVRVGRREFGKRVEWLAEASGNCEYLVPVTAYLYAKRIKFVLSDYHPMGSLADLLAGARQHGHTALDWNQRLTIVVHIARAIAYIHEQYPPYEKRMQMNVHGSIKASNVLININFSACLSDYGFTQLAEPVEVPRNTWQQMKSPCWLLENTNYSDELSQKSDIYNFGVILLDILAGPKGLDMITKGMKLEKEDIKLAGGLEFFEFDVKEGKEKRQVAKVLELALACTNGKAEARPSIAQIYFHILEIL